MTRVHFTVVGDRRDMYNHEDLILDMDAVPRKDETVHMPGGVPLSVRRVAHYPWGTEDTPIPFVYVVLGDQ